MCEYSIRSSSRHNVHLKLVKELENQENIIKVRKLENIKHDYTTAMRISNDDGNEIQIEITLERKFLRSFIENIVPTGPLVVVSWVSKI